MTRVSINPGKVEWSGEGHQIHLRTDDGKTSALAALIRADLSPFGRGRVAVVLGEPDKMCGWPNAANLLLTDNQQLASWLMNGWVHNLPAFSAKTGLQSLGWLHLESCVTSLEPPDVGFSAQIRGSDLEVEMIWSGLTAPVPFEANAARSLSGKYDVYSVTMVSETASLSVNGTALAGRTQIHAQPDEHLLHSFLSFSVTYVAATASD